MIQTSPLINNSEIVLDQMIYTGQLNMSLHHMHDLYELLYLRSGQHTLYMYGRSYLLDRNCIAIIPSGTPHTTVPCGQEQQDYICIYFSLGLFQRLMGAAADELETMLSSVPLVLPLEAGEQLLVNGDIDTLHSLSQDSSAMKELKQQAAFLHLFMALFPKIEAAYAGTSPAEMQLLVDNNVFFREVFSYLKENYLRHITLDDLSARFGLSKSHLSSKLNQHLGTSWVTYVNNLRITQAQQLLDTPGSNISEISAAVGFDSLTHFERVFRSITGQSPTQYIRSQRSREAGAR